MQTSEKPRTIDLAEFADAIDSAPFEYAVCSVATADTDGAPDISLKGSVMVFDRDRMAFWERAHGQTIENLRHNPKIAILYRNRERKISGLRFYGVAEVLPSGDLREQVRARTVPAELEKDPDNKGIAVVIRVDRVSDMRTTIQQR